MELIKISITAHIQFPRPKVKPINECSALLIILFSKVGHMKWLAGRGLCNTALHRTNYHC